MDTFEQKIEALLSYGSHKIGVFVGPAMEAVEIDPDVFFDVTLKHFDFMTEEKFVVVYCPQCQSTMRRHITGQDDPAQATVMVLVWFRAINEDCKYVQNVKLVDSVISS